MQINVKTLVYIIFAFAIDGCGGKMANDQAEVTVTPVGSLQGIVKDANTGLFLSDVTVMISDKFDKTSEIGFYTIKNVSSGQHRFTFSKAGYKDFINPVMEVKTGLSLNYDVVMSPETSDGISLSGNATPVADAGKDESIKVNTEATLDASNSYDINIDDVLTYEWSIESAPADSTALLNDPKNIAIQFTPDVVGDYTFRLHTSDGKKLSFDTVILSVTDITDDSPPNAITNIENKKVHYLIKEQINIDASNSYDPDVNGVPLTYSWGLYYKPILSKIPNEIDNNVESIAFEPDVVGTYIVSLTVTDGAGKTDIDYTTITMVSDFYVNADLKKFCMQNNTFFYDEINTWNNWSDPDWGDLFIPWMNQPDYNCWIKIEFDMPAFTLPSMPRVNLVGAFQHESSGIGDGIYINDNMSVYKSGETNHFFIGGTSYTHSRSTNLANPANGWIISPVQLPVVNEDLNALNTYYVWTDDRGHEGGIGKMKIRIFSPN